MTICCNSHGDNGSKCFKSNSVMQEEGIEGGEGMEMPIGLQRRMSTPLLLNYSPLDFMEQLSEGDAFNGQPFFLASPGARLPSAAPLPNIWLA